MEQQGLLDQVAGRSGGRRVISRLKGGGALGLETPAQGADGTFGPSQLACNGGWTVAALEVQPDALSIGEGQRSRHRAS